MPVQDAEILKKLLLQEEPEQETLPQGFEDDPMGFILKKYPGLNTVMEYMMTESFREFVDAIFVIAPKPTTFKILLHNGQFFFLQFMGKTYQATVLGKNYYLMSIGEKERCMLAIARLLRYGSPLKTKGPEGGEQGTRPEGETGGEGGEGGESAPETPPAETSGEEGGETLEESRSVLKKLLESDFFTEEDEEQMKKEPEGKVIKTHEELIKKTLGVEQIPVPKTKVELGKNFTITDKEDLKIWKQLFEISPVSKKGSSSKATGHGEVSVAWLFSGEGKKVEDSTGSDNPDLRVDGVGLEVKAYDKDTIVLGKFAKDSESVKTLNTIFGLYTLLTTISSQGKKKQTQHNSNNFSFEALINACQKFKDVDSNETLRDYKNIEIIQAIYDKIDQVKKDIGLPEGYKSEDMAYQVAKIMLTNKLKVKPGLGGYILDCTSYGTGTFIAITQEAIDNIKPEKIKSAVAVNSAQININVKKLFSK